MCTTIKNKHRNRPVDDRRFLENMPKFKKFTRLMEDEPDISSMSVIREFSGRMTRRRYKYLSHLCRFYSRRFKYRCGHDYDCCGCCFSIDIGFSYQRNQVSIFITYSFNY